MSIIVLQILLCWIVCCFSYKHAYYFRKGNKVSSRNFLPAAIEVVIDGKRSLKKNMIFIPDLIFETVNDDPTISSLKSYDSFDYNILTLNTGVKDNSTFFELSSVVTKAIQESNQNVVLMGEGVGALLAAYVSTQVEKNKISKLVLLNPIISESSTFEAIMEHALLTDNNRIPSNKTSLSNTLSRFFNNTKTIIHDTLYSSTVPSRINYDERNTSLLMKTTEHSLKLLQVGKTLMENKWSQIQVPTLVLTINMKKEYQSKNTKAHVPPLPIQVIFPIAFYRLIGIIINPLDIKISIDRHNDGKKLKNLMKKCENFELKDITLKHLSRKVADDSLSKKNKSSQELYTDSGRRFHLAKEIIHSDIFKVY